MPAPGASMILKLPSGERRKPCRAEFASRVNPVIAPAGLMPKATVPWPGPLPALGASNVVMVVLHSPAFAKNPDPNVQRMTMERSQLLLLDKVVFIVCFCKLLFIGKSPEITRSRQKGLPVSLVAGGEGLELPGIGE